MIFDTEKLIQLNSKEDNFFTIDVAFSVYLKIFINYLQMIASFSQLDLSLPSYIQDYLDISSVFGSVPTQFMSIDCLIGGNIYIYIHIFQYNIAFDENYSKNLNFIFALVLPFILYFFMIMVLLTIEIIKRQKKFHRLLIAFILINIFIQPYLVKQGFSGLDCLELYDNKSFMVAVDLSMQCYTYDYYKLVKYIYIYKYIYINSLL